MKRLIFLLTMLIALAAPATSFAAFDPLQNACGSGGGASGSAACAQNKDPIVGTNGVLHKVSLIIATVAGVIAVIIIIIGGIQLIMSGGDPQKVANARSAIIGAAIGIVIIAGAEGILLFVVSRL